MARAGGLPLPTITDDRALGAADIQRSLRFNDDDSASLTRTPSSAGNRKIFTLSVWIKRSKLGTDQAILDAQNSSGDQATLRFSSEGGSDNKIHVFYYNGSSFVYRVHTNAELRDTNGWYHLIIAFDTTQATAANRIKIYQNGVQITSMGNSDYPSENYDTPFNNTVVHTIGRNGTASNYFDGYMAEFNFIDGQQLSPTDVGFTDSQTGLWMPKRYEGTYGTNGFYLDFSDNSSTAALGIDKSPNGNDFTVNSPIAVTDSMLDTPTNIFCAWNPLSTSNLPDLQEGSLKNMGTNNTACNGTFGVTSGKWYWEQYCLTDISSSSYITTAGVTQYEMENDGDVEPRLGYTTGRSFYRGGSTGGYYNYKNYSQTSSTEVNSGGTYWGGKVVSFRLDMDAGTLKYYTNNTLVHTDSSIPTDGTRIFPLNSNTNSGTSRYNSIVSNFGQDSSFAGNKTAQGNTDENGIGDFYYAVPSGFKALNLKNLPITTPSIVNPQKHFKCVTYTGNASTQKINLGFKPDMIWFKSRQSSSTFGSADSVRGASKLVYQNTSQAEETSGSGRDLASFDDDGFTLGNPQILSSTNGSGLSIVAWCWKAGGAAVSNTDGDQTTQVSVNEEAGFSIVTYTGTGSNTNIGHGLGATPNIVITKSRSTTGSWAILDTVGNSSAEYGLFLNDNGGYSSYQGGTYWNDTLPTSTVFRVSSNAATNASGVTYVAYCWTSIPGFSKFGKYTGNGSNDGTFIHTGFRPAWVTVKQTNASNNWQTWDSARESSNVMQRILEFNDASTADDASSNTAIDFLSNGFKHRTSFTRSNDSGDTYIYMAFAEEPGTTPFDTFPNAR